MNYETYENYETINMMYRTLFDLRKKENPTDNEIKLMDLLSDAACLLYDITLGE